MSIPRRFRSQAGFSLVELMIVLGAIAALIGVITLGAGAVNSSRISAAEQDIRSLYSGANAWAAQQAPPTFAGATVAAMKAVGILPATTPGTNPWGSAYTTSGDATSFTVTTDASTAANCTALSTRFATVAASATCNTSTLTVTF